MRCRMVICFLYFLSTSVICGIILCMLYANVMKTFFEPDIYTKVDDLARTVRKLCSDIEKLQNPSCNPKLIEDSVSKQAEHLRKELSEQKEAVNQMSSKCKMDIFSGSKTNYALESLGASIAHVKDKPYHRENFLLRLFGFQSISNLPANVLNPSMYPGNCYAYKGGKSVLIIKLSKKIYIDSVSITHITESVSPTGEVTSAPKCFTVHGLNTAKDTQGFCFGTFSYNIHIQKPQQVFQFANLSPNSYRYVKFNFTSNNGNPKWTCIYKIGVHGKI